MTEMCFILSVFSLTVSVFCCVRVGRLTEIERLIKEVRRQKLSKGAGM
jgi:hypothetical protein